MKSFIKYVLLIAVFVGLQSKVFANTFKVYNEGLTNSTFILKSLKHIDDQTIPNFNILIDVEFDNENEDSLSKTINLPLCNYFVLNLNHNNVVLTISKIKPFTYLTSALLNKICVFRI
ncbi:MAG: hypothetical protein LCH32_13790 [Bacteroidetes bacterium]|nr:hypothetical protein [Bacteroidota bacterium]